MSPEVVPTTALRLVLGRRSPAAFTRLRFDAALEAQAFRELASLQLDACRDSFARLVDGLEIRDGGVAEREVVLLLVDVLHRVNRRLHRPPHGDEMCQQNRATLIATFASLDSAARARQEFLTALDDFLDVLRAPATAHPLVEKTRSYIDENYQRRLSLSGIARALNVSPNYLSRLVRRETGLTLTAQIHHARLEHARLLLAAGGRSISEIAYMVGYQNYRDFYRNFVKYERATPRQARRSLQPAADSSSARPGD